MTATQPKPQPRPAMQAAADPLDDLLLDVLFARATRKVLNCSKAKQERE